MRPSSENNFKPEDNQLIIREQKAQYLPSTEIRELVSEFRDEINLRDLIDTIIRRRTVVLICILFCFSTVALYTFIVTPQFNAMGVLKVSSQSDKLIKFDDEEPTVMKNMEFQQTQVQLLQSEQLALRVIDRMDLINNPDFNKKPQTNSDEAQAKGFLEIVRSFIRPEEDMAPLSLLDEEAQDRIIIDRSLKIFKNLFSVNPVRKTELIELSFTSVSADLAAEVTNTAMDEFINMHMDSRLKVSQSAGKFLRRQIEAAQIKLEKSELELQAFAQKIGIVSLDPKQNLIMRQLEELNDALARARANRIALEARYFQLNSPDSTGNLFRMVENELIQNLKNQQVTLLAEYKQLSTTFKPGYPRMLQLKAQMDETEQRIEAEKNAIFDSIRDEYETAKKAEEYLVIRTEEQKQRAMELEEKATQYKILAREAETNKFIYQSLLERSKQIEATLGSSVTNIQIIDMARPPLSPFRPRIVLNLALSLVMGTAVGVVAAFFFEYFDNTIKNPDEMIERFGIPVLGLVPYDKTAANDRTTMALKFFNEPRSPVAEAIRTTMTSVRLSVADDPPKTILFTSILAGAGKSSLSSNACLSYLSEDERCLLIDADLRKPCLHHVFNEGLKGQGLSSFLSGITKLTDVIMPTSYPGLDFISSGPLPPNPAELLSSKRMRQFLQSVSGDYDRVVLDAPPYQGFAEILVLSNMVDGVILVAVEGDTPREGVRYFSRAIRNVGGRILGTIINKSGEKKSYSSYSGYKYYSYNYDYGQESRG